MPRLTLDDLEAEQRAGLERLKTELKTWNWDVGEFVQVVSEHLCVKAGGAVADQMVLDLNGPLEPHWDADGFFVSVKIGGEEDGFYVTWSVSDAIKDAGKEYDAEEAAGLVTLLRSLADKIESDCQLPASHGAKAR